MTGERGGDLNGVMVVGETFDAENRRTFDGTAKERVLADSF